MPRPFTRHAFGTAIAMAIAVAFISACGGTPAKGDDEGGHAGSSADRDAQADAQANAGTSGSDATDGGNGNAGGNAVDAGGEDAASADAGEPPPPPLLSWTPEAGTFAAPIELTLEPDDTGGTLYYTLDGTYPSHSSTKYEAPIAISATTLVRVAAYDEAGTLLGVRSASYIALDASAQAFDSNLPLVIVHMLGDVAPQSDVYTNVSAILQVHDRGAVSGRATLLGSAEDDDRIGIRIRGRSTRQQVKPNYTVELRDQYDDDDESAQLLDLPAQSDWVLYAPFDIDRALIRNAFFYDLSRKVGRYAPRTRFVEVFLAHSGAAVTSADYLGVYVLTERIKRDRNRVAVESLAASVSTEPGISGGYIVHIDNVDDGEKFFDMPGATIGTNPEKQPPMTDLDDGYHEVVVAYPDGDSITDPQLAYLTDYVGRAGRALSAVDQTDPMSPHDEASDLVDVGSFIDHHILNLLAKNPDGLRLSAYMHKARGGKLIAGPVWDCDRCLGAYDDRQTDPNGWNPKNDTDIFATQYFTHGFWATFLDDGTTNDLYWARWDELLAGPLKLTAMNATIDAMAGELAEAAVRNAKRWPEAAPEHDDVNGKFENEIAAMKTWLSSRIAFIEANLRNP